MSVKLGTWMHHLQQTVRQQMLPNPTPVSAHHLTQPMHITHHSTIITSYTSKRRMLRGRKNIYTKREGIKCRFKPTSVIFPKAVATVDTGKKRCELKLRRQSLRSDNRVWLSFADELKS